ncbi:MAG TPA: signal peptidase I [Pseudolysinimonas sp.]|nr:signal peptidase I [Pseudolysinimonas sp.]
MWHPGLPSSPPSGTPAGRGAHWGWLIVAAIARGYLVFILALVACALSPLVGGLSGSVVQSGSMRPHIDPGDVVLTAPLAKDAEVPLGRVVTFEAPAGSAHEGLVLHRIVAVNNDGTLVTQGDANPQADSAPLDRENILARAVILVPYIGLPSLWLSTGNTLPLAAWVALTIVALLIESARILAIPGKHRLVRPRPARSPALATFALRAGPFVTVAAAVAVLSVSVFGQSSAGFTGTTTSVGNNWAYAASGPATKLAFATSPSASTGGIAFPTQPVVVVQDASGRTANTTAAQVTLEITTPAGAVLSCASNPRAAVDGRATFAGCSINKNGTYTLTARSGTLTAAVSASFVISVGPAARLQFTTQPSTSVVAGANLATQPRVTVQDAGGNTVTTSTAPVTLALTTPGTATLTCTTNPRAAVAGVAVFAGCRVNRTGTYTFTATSGALAAATSTAFTVTPGTASKLAFSTSPLDTPGSVPFNPQPEVVIQDVNGNTVTTSTASVTLSITGTPGGTTLTCSGNPRAAVAGVATYSGCSINKKGTYTLRAVSGSLTAATSASFTIG